MKTTSPRKFSQAEKDRNEVILQFLDLGTDKEKVSAERKIRELVMENIQLKQQLLNRAFKTNEVLNHNHKIVSIIAHDLRSPYNTVLGTLDFLKKNSATMNQEVLNSYFNLIYHTTNNALDLLDCLLDWTTLNKNSKKFNPILFNLHHIVTGVLQNLKPISDLKEISIVNKVPSHLVVIADQNMITTILRNLVTNAIQYNHHGGNVVLSAYFEDDRLEVEVSDSGIGINDESLDQLSVSLNSEKTTICAEESWKGLGLMFCKEFIGMHGGDLKIESKVGVGTKVKFTIPNADYYP